MRQQQTQSVADQIGRRFVSCIQQKHTVVQQLRKRKIRLLHQAAQQIVLQRMTAAILDQNAQIVSKFAYRLITRGTLLFADRRLQGAEDGKRPAAQWLPILVRHSQQVTNHLNGNRRREVLDEIESLPLLDPVQQAVDERDDLRLHGLQHVWREGADDMTPHSRVVRRVVEYETGGVMLV